MNLLRKVSNFSEKYINKFRYILGTVVSNIYLLHNRIKEFNILSDEQPQFKNPYMSATEFVVDIVVYGFLLFVIWAVFITQVRGFAHAFLLIISLGIVRWFILDILSDGVAILKSDNKRK